MKARQTRPMLWTLLVNDLKSTRVQSSVIAAFVILASLLLSLAGMLTVDLMGAVDRLMDRAKSPDYIQMHRGAVDEAALAAFAEAQPEVLDWQAFAFVTIPARRSSWGRTVCMAAFRTTGWSFRTNASTSSWALTTRY